MLKTVLMLLFTTILTTGAVDYCEDIEEQVKKFSSLPVNGLKGSRKCISKNKINISKGTTLPINNNPDVCNFWKNVKPFPLAIAPWPSECEIY